MAYRPSAPFAVPMKLLAPTVSDKLGVTVKTFPDPDEVDTIFFGSFRTFGGTERTVNDVYTLEDTATIDTWYDPAFTAECRIYLPEQNATYEVLGSPENIDMRNQYTRLKVRKVGGVA